MSKKAGHMKKISVVIPALNEEQGIEGTIKAVPKDELERMGYEVQILVVDNGSHDGTGELARKAGAEVIFEPRRGYGNAFKAGFARATGDIIATADADLTYPIEDIPKLVTMLEVEKLDFLTTNRFALMEKNAMSFRNKVGNTLLALTTRILFGLKMRDPESGMWVFRKGILNELKLNSDIWPFSHEVKIEACYFNKCRWREVPVRYRARSGKTKLPGWKVGFVDLLHLIKKRMFR
jgi:glycosyltransferase involved in cell wall biosynthesis